MQNPSRHPHAASNLFYPLLLIAGAGLSALGWAMSGHGQAVWLILANMGMAIIIGTLLLWPLAITLERLHRSAEVSREATNKLLDDRLQQVSILLTLISEQQLLSDRAKGVAFRDKDRDALRRAIQEEILRQDWEAAMVLANDMEASFGYSQEAERTRQEIRGRKDETIRRQISEHLATIDRHTRAELWSDAMREAEKAMARFPGHEMVRNLPAEIEARRSGHKKQLMDAWQEAVARHDVDGSIELLKKLDVYLTPTEAESMQETARGIFKEKLNGMRQQFATAVQDHRWGEAIRLGDVIIRDFPNTRIATEVREKMDALRQRASEPAEVAKA